jgi:hypothetical protein
MSENCSKCGADIGDTFEPTDYSVGIVGGWYCEACELDIGREPLEDDVPIITAKELRGEKQLGTPLSELSGRPGTEGYANFVRIAKTWGYD